MKKRLRKKKHLGEFKEIGVPIAIKRKNEDEFDSFLDDFIVDAIERNECYFGGGGSKKDLNGVIELGKITDNRDARLEKIKSWLDKRDDIDKFVIGNEFDIWYGPFDEMDNISKKL